jgi:hypothetical protein
VLGIDGALFDAGGRGSNESLGRESAELMLRVNQVSRLREVDWKTYEEMFKHSLAKRGLSKRRHVESPQRGLPPELEEWARARTAEQVRAIVASGASVVGDLAELEPVFGPRTDEAPTDPEAVLEAAVEGLVALAKDRGAELERLRRRAERFSLKGRRSAESVRTLAEKSHLDKAVRKVRSAMGRAGRSR